MSLPMLDCKGIIDSHAHYFDKRFEKEAEGGSELVLKNVFNGGIEGVINIGTNVENSLVAVKQAEKYEKMYVAVGIHPEDAMYLTGEPEAHVRAIREMVDTKEKRRASKIVAIGEIGLDYHCESCDREKQSEYFCRQLSLAEELSMPVVIHDRDAHGDCFETVLKYPNVTGVFHSFSGSAEMARELVKRGWYISFSGVLTFKNAKRVREVASCVPRDRILIETDAPYLSPEPYRGRMNSSLYMCHTAKTLSEILGVSYEKTVEITAENTKRLFSI